MAKSKKTIIVEMDAHITSEGSGYKAWYVGITNDFDRRLFTEHNVTKGKGKAWWIRRTASSEAIAREIEEHFHDLGCKGGGGGGEDDSNIVYAYKITSSTKE